MAIMRRSAYKMTFLTPSPRCHRGMGEQDLRMKCVDVSSKINGER